MDLDGQVVFNIGTGWLHPDSQIETDGKVPAGVYFSRDQFENEKEMFGHVWLNVAEESEVPNIGDWVIRDVTIRSVSMIIVRGKDNKVHAFHNICSHRGMKLVWDAEGRGGKFACRYHSWIYDSTGTLINIPDPDCFPQVDREDCALTAIHCDTWQGFIYINLDNNPKQTLLEYLGPVAERLEGAPFGAFPVSTRLLSTVKANWKLVQEGQIEGYHGPSLHARTVGKMVTTKENPMNRALYWEALGAHQQQSVQVDTGYKPQTSRLVQSFAVNNSTHILLSDDSDIGIGFASLPKVNISKSADWAVEQFNVYPNFVIHISPGGWFYHRFWPIDEETTLWEVVYHFRNSANIREQFANEFNLGFNRDTLTEDHVASEMQQAQLPSGVRKHIIFGEKTELMCRHFAAVNFSVTGALNDLVPAAAE